MKFYLIAGLATMVLASHSNALSTLESRNLLERTGFTPSFDEVLQYAELSYEQSVDRLLNQVSTQHFAELPQGIQLPQLTPSPSASEKERQEYRKEQRRLGGELQVWWLSQMLATESPLTEQMVLFWHSHFVSSLSKVKSPVLMYQQNQLFRELAFGNYRDLVQAVSKDPAMTIYLDNQSNKKTAPNENYARELLELFTLGEGNYTEADIKEAARAFTGWQVNRRNGEFHVNKRQHDNGEKTVFGQTGNWNGDEIVDLIFEEKGEQAALFLVEKLYRYFVSSKVNDETVSDLAALFVQEDFEIKPLLRALLLSKDFQRASAERSLVKSPVDLVVGTQRALGLSISNIGIVQQMGRNMNQMLFNPPNVKGWPGGEQWITSSTLLARTQLMGQVTKAVADAVVEKSMGYDRFTRFDAAQWTTLLAAEFKFDEPMPAGIDALEQLEAAVSTVLQDPRYQLK
jgi:uncharacterized protein (DUF1800 family)